jgi:hypothetical protein
MVVGKSVVHFFDVLMVWMEWNEVRQLRCKQKVLIKSFFVTVFTILHDNKMYKTKQGYDIYISHTSCFYCFQNTVFAKHSIDLILSPPLLPSPSSYSCSSLISLCLC